MSTSHPPEEWLALAETYTRLCHTLNALPPVQGRRVDVYYFQSMSFQAIAQAEGGEPPRGASCG